MNVGARSHQAGARDNTACVEERIRTTQWRVSGIGPAIRVHGFADALRNPTRCDNPSVSALSFDDLAEDVAHIVLDLADARFQ